MHEYSRSHSRSQSDNKASFDAPRGYDRTRDHSTSPLIPAIRTCGRSESTDRGRTLRRRYEFIDSDDKTYTVLSPVQEAAKKNNGGCDGPSANSIGHESDTTTVTDLMQRCMEQYPPELPPLRLRKQQQQVNVGVGITAARPSLVQPKVKHRPPPLNLEGPVYVRKFKHTDRYKIEHVAIKSSKAELFDLHGPRTSSSVQDDRVEKAADIKPPHIPSVREPRGPDLLQLYGEWRADTRHAAAPTGEEDAFPAGKKTDDDRLPIASHPIARSTPNINHVRSRSTLGIGEEREREARQRQFSGDLLYTPSVYCSTPFSAGPGIARSVTMHGAPHRSRQFSSGSGSKTETPSPPFTPLTPFIMGASGAPAGVERGSKTLFGQHGWLEDTAASGAARPKAEKMSGFLESLKRKAREIVRDAASFHLLLSSSSSSSYSFPWRKPTFSNSLLSQADSTAAFKPARHTNGGGGNSRASVVNRIRISLDAREQSLLYCELEYGLSNALDAYLRAQLDGGRLEASKLSRVAGAWAHRGRPRVVGFRYDVETQVGLVAAHADEFRFYGPLLAGGGGGAGVGGGVGGDGGGVGAAVAGLLGAVAADARCMRVRTFCQPDSVIAKHVLDAQALLRLLGSPEALQRPLEEVAQFFKVAVDRRRAMAEMPSAATRHLADGARAASGGGGRIASGSSSGQRVRFQDEHHHAKGTKVYGSARGRSDAGYRQGL
ncbi:hypothetical protein F4802DRAFT_326368 [Xylaria palmicola]|nr:hypothetical protein F4802DRAFT_326368 [Xylaria palmicola]